jgi:hypothetical protein
MFGDKVWISREIAFIIDQLVADDITGTCIQATEGEKMSGRRRE